jgi:hypothetical protein
VLGTKAATGFCQLMELLESSSAVKERSSAARQRWGGGGDGSGLGLAWAWGSGSPSPASSSSSCVSTSSSSLLLPSLLSFFFTTVNVTQSDRFYRKVLKTINCTRRSETTRETFLTRVVRDSLAIWCDRQMMCDCKTAPAGAQAASHRRHAQRCKLLCARAKTMRVHA